MMQARLPVGALHQYVPLDLPGAVARFLDTWKPEAGLFVESDLWPNLILAASRRGIKLALVNARISARSAANWRHAPRTAKACWAHSTPCWRRMMKSRSDCGNWAHAMSW